MKKFFSDIANQLWTLLGMFIAWVVLDGSAKTIIRTKTITTKPRLIYKEQDYKRKAEENLKKK